MQAITIAIGKNGIQFFAQALIGDQLIQLVSRMAPPDKQIDIDSFTIGVSSVDNLVITLS